MNVVKQYTDLAGLTADLNAQDQLPGLTEAGWTGSLTNQLANIQNSLVKLGFRKQRYAETIRQALRDGRFAEGEISSKLGAQLRNLQERLAVKGLAQSGAADMLGGDLAQEAALKRRQNAQKTAGAVAAASGRLAELNAETRQEEAEAARLLAQVDQQKRRG